MTMMDEIRSRARAWAETQVETKLWIDANIRAGITGAHLFTLRWFEAYQEGVIIAQDPQTMRVYELCRDAAVMLDISKRFADDVGVDVPSAYLLGFKDELERILRRHRCY